MPSYLYHAKWFEQEKGLGLRAQVLKEARDPPGVSVMVVTGIRRMEQMQRGRNPESGLKARFHWLLPTPSPPPVLLKALFAESECDLCKKACMGSSPIGLLPQGSQTLPQESRETFYRLP